jgi:hypothetical protein
MIVRTSISPAARAPAETGGIGAAVRVALAEVVGRDGAALVVMAALVDGAAVGATAGATEVAIADVGGASVDDGVRAAVDPRPHPALASMSTSANPHNEAGRLGTRQSFCSGA